MTGVYDLIKKVSGELYVRALKSVPTDVLTALKDAYVREDSDTGKMVLETILKNVDVAEQHDMLVCQDTGTPVYCVVVGEDVSLNFGELYRAVSRGVSEATRSYNLRPNMVDPLSRESRGDNVGNRIPVVHVEYDERLGSSIKIVCVPKGSGSENQSFLRMLPPAEGLRGVVSFVIESVIAGANKACPPVIVGVGIGGTFDECAWLAKKAATIRRIDTHHPDPKIRALEERLLKAINETGIGPMGLGGRTTALAVNVEVADTHISQLPVAVNTQCWKGQRAEAVISNNLEVEYIM